MDSQYNEDERRISKRLRANFTFTYSVDKPLSVRMMVGWDTRIDALMLDLSEDGMAILSSYDIPVSTILSLKFTLINVNAVNEEDHIKTLEAVGEVRSNVLTEDKKEHRLGIHFVDVSKEGRISIANFAKILNSQ